MIRMVTAELVETKCKVEKKRRKMADEARRAEVVADYAKSGLPQAAYPKANGINLNNLVYWLMLSRRCGLRSYF